MTPNELLPEIEARLSKKRTNELAVIVIYTHFPLSALIDLTFHHQAQIAFRAAWILEQVCLKKPSLMELHLDDFLGKFAGQKNPSAQRHFAKILFVLTAKKSSSSAIIHSTSAEQLIEAVFSWLIDQQSPVAVKAHCLDILANFAAANHWVKDELLQTIDFMIGQESIAFHARAKKVMRRLELENKE